MSAVAAGASHTLFLKSDGTGWASGYNLSGRLCDGSDTQRLSAVQVKEDASTYLSGVVAIAAGSNFSAVLKSDGTVWTGGANGSRQLGVNSLTPTQSLYPVRVKTGASTFLRAWRGSLREIAMFWPSRPTVSLSRGETTAAAVSASALRRKLGSRPRHFPLGAP